MTRKFLFVKIVCLCCVLSDYTMAQSSLPDSALLAMAVRKTIGVHNAALGENIHLYNGPQNTGYNHTSIGHPYFMEDSVQTGTVFYDGILYQDVPMLYDLQQDNVVIVQYNTGEYAKEYRDILRMDLVPIRIEWFTLPGHEFVHLEPDSLHKNISAGFYERAYNGNTSFFIRREKRYEEFVTSLDLQRRYNFYIQYFIRKAGVYHAVKNKKTVLSLFADKRPELKSFIRKNGLVFKRNHEYFITAVTRYYDQLTK